ncbi:biotin-dependent carboxyltransferase family protein [Phyllobacterium sp. TAF24]|uniref:5-oxoprolinase subunit C family protein n=1 Tax=Phyllobacterium sp. TAF24 TaxID=3233068 RepID=UPI003F9A1EAD
MVIKVISPGLSTTIQDLGRPGYFHLGIPLGGAMDRLALRAANLLVGNEESAACLEAVFVGPELEFTKDTLIAVTGADMPMQINGEAKPGWTAIDVKAGQTLSFEFLTTGARIYIAVAGGINVPIVLGSRSTYIIGALGGFQGRAIAKNDELPVGPSGRLREGLALESSLRPNTSTPVELRVLPGLYWHRLQKVSTSSFFEDQWKVASEADRMGYRFRGGRALQFVDREPPFGAGSDPSNIVDSCYPYGSIQVPNGTEPIILHRDAVSGGGYCTIGTVISADMDVIGQMQPNTPTRFVEVDMNTALAARADRAVLLRRIRHALE